MDENKKIMDNVPVFDEKYIIGNIDEKRKEEMIEKLDSTNGFVKWGIEYIWKKENLIMNY